VDTLKHAPHLFGDAWPVGVETRVVQSEPVADELEPDVAGLGQCMTPGFAVDPLIELFGLRADDQVVEPSCGTGSFLGGIPAHIPAIGVEIDPRYAEIARTRTGRRVLIGDFRKIDLEGFRPTVLLGNPPFDLKIIDGFLDRAYGLLPKYGRIGWILPAYAFQTPGRVMRYNARYSISQTFIPRTLFPGLSKPLCFAIFEKDELRRLVGFALYQETVEVKALPERFRAILESDDGPVWLKLVTEALVELKGRGTIEQVFRIIEPRAPRGNSFPRNSTRKTLYQHFKQVGPAEFQIPDAA
jgi:hypothetical protein